GTIQDQQLLFDQNGFSDNRTRAAGSCESGDSRNQMDEKDSQIAHHTMLTRSRNPRNAHKFGICLFTLRKERQSSLSNQVEHYSVVFPVLRLAAQRLLAASESFFRPAAVSVPLRFGLDPVRAWPVTLAPVTPVRVFRGVRSFPTPCRLSSLISASILERSASSPLRASSSSLLLLGI